MFIVFRLAFPGQFDDAFEVAYPNGWLAARFLDHRILSKLRRKRGGWSITLTPPVLPQPQEAPNA